MYAYNSGWIALSINGCRCLVLNTKWIKFLTNDCGMIDLILLWENVFHPFGACVYVCVLMYVGTSPYAMLCRLVEALSSQIHDVFVVNITRNPNGVKYYSIGFLPNATLCYIASLRLWLFLIYDVFLQIKSCKAPTGRNIITSGFYPMKKNDNRSPEWAVYFVGMKNPNTYPPHHLLRERQPIRDAPLPLRK